MSGPFGYSILKRSKRSKKETLMQFLKDLFNLLFPASPKTADEPRHDRVTDDKFMQSGVWGTINGQIVDLRRHDPVRAARALGLTARYEQWIEDSRTKDDEIIVHEIRPYVVH